MHQNFSNILTSNIVKNAKQGKYCNNLLGILSYYFYYKKDDMIISIYFGDYLYITLIKL